MRKLCLLVAFLLPLLAQAQTTFTNQPAACNTTISCSLAQVNGTGNFTFAAVLGPLCPLGQTCSFGYSYVGSFFAYQLSDGSSANMTDFTGEMTYTGLESCGQGCSAYHYTLTGSFSGQDSRGRAVVGSTLQDIIINHSRGNSARDTGGTTTMAISAASAPAAPSLTISAASAPPAISAGQTANVTINATGNALAAPVTLSCLGLPAGAACSFAPPSLILGTGSASSILSISTTARTSAAHRHGNLLQLSLLPGLGIVLVLPGRRRLLLAAVLGLLVLIWIGCGGVTGTATGTTNSPSAPSSSGGTPAGVFQIAVTGTSGSATSSTSFTLVVN